MAGSIKKTPAALALAGIMAISGNAIVNDNGTGDLQLDGETIPTATEQKIDHILEIIGSEEAGKEPEEDVLVFTENITLPKVTKDTQPLPQIPTADPEPAECVAQVITKRIEVPGPTKVVRYNRVTDAAPNPYVFAHNDAFKRVKAALGDKHAVAALGGEIGKQTPIEAHLRQINRIVALYITQQQNVQKFKGQYDSLVAESKKSVAACQVPSYAEQVNALREKYEDE